MTEKEFDAAILKALTDLKAVFPSFYLMAYDGHRHLESGWSGDANMVRWLIERVRGDAEEIQGRSDDLIVTPCRIDG